MAWLAAYLSKSGQYSGETPEQACIAAPHVFTEQLEHCALLPSIMQSPMQFEIVHDVISEKQERQSSDMSG